MLKKNSRSRVEKLSALQIEEMTDKAERRKNIPLVKSQQVNMRIRGDTLAKAKKLAAAQGLPYTSYLARLLKEDIERLWGVFKKAN
jgi:predicted DNA binding CopG/RHH family protein